MSKAKKRHTRKRRRQQKAMLGNRKAAPTHKLIAGRTGAVHHKKTKARATMFVIHHPSFDWGGLIDKLFAVK